MKVSTKFNVDTTIRCLVIVIAADTLHDLETLTFDLLTLVSGHTWRVTWSIHRPSLKIPWLSVLQLWVLTSPIGYHWQCVCSHCACAVSRDLCVGGNFFPHIWNPWPRFAYSVYNFYDATINRLWQLAQHDRSVRDTFCRRVTYASRSMQKQCFLALDVDR